MRKLAGSTVVGLLVGCFLPAMAVPAGAAAPAVAAGTPVPGSRNVPAATSLTFRGVPRSGLTVVGSRSGIHPGHLQPTPGGGSAFTPDRPFAGGEQVTVSGPGIQAYSFSTAVDASPAQAAAALRQVRTDDGATTSGVHAADTPACPVVTYHTAPVQPGVCMNLGVPTTGTQPGTDLFLTPGTAAGIWTDTGTQVWYFPGTNYYGEQVVQYQGQPYLAVWRNGEIELFDNHYQPAGTVTAAGSFSPNAVDLHEFQLTSDGNALIGINNAIAQTVNGRQETVVQYVVQKLSLVKDATGIHTEGLLFQWNSLGGDVPVSQSQVSDPFPNGWDYFHGNAIAEDTDGNLLVSARNTWGIYKIDDTSPSDDPHYGHVMWEVGATGDKQLAEPWCYQHDIRPLGNNTYSLFDDGGAGPGCQPGSSEHEARGLIVTVDPTTSPAGVVLVQAYTHDPPILTQFTGSTEVLPNGDVLVGWANMPQLTEFDSAQNVRMDLTMTAGSYRDLRFAWDGQPAQPPTIATQAAPGSVNVWVSWNGSTEVAAWRVVAGPGPASLSPVGSPHPKTGFETAIVVPGTYPALAVQALNSAGAVLATSPVTSSFGQVLAGGSGSVGTGGVVPLSGSLAGVHLAAPIVGMAALPGGYWMAGRDGGVFAFGRSHFFGSAGRVHLAAPVVGMAALPGGNGYWLVASDGGVFAFGSARFFGSTGRVHLAAPVVGMAATPDGGGYWLVASDGGVFSFGDARFYGSVAGVHLDAPVAGMAAAPGGYWLVARDGGVFAFGRARFFGSFGGSHPPAPVIGLAPVPTGAGYWLAEANGTTFLLQGSPPLLRQDLPIQGVVAISVVTAGSP